MAATQISNRQHSNTPGVVDIEQFISLTTAYTLTSQTALQKLFNATTNGALTVLAATTYFFECSFDLSAMSATSGNFGFGFAGTATITSLRYSSDAQKSSAIGTPSNGQTTIGIASTATGLVTASLITTGTAFITGIIRTNAAGTLIPSVSLGIASAAVVGVNSYFRINPVGTNATTNVGLWT